MVNRDMRRARAQQRRNKRLAKRRVAASSRTSAAKETPHADAIVRAVVAHLGAPPAFVIHEHESELVHLDVHVVPPAAGRDYWFLFTTGMSARPMTVPFDVDSSPLAEVSLKLPRDWVFDRATWMRQPRWFWPIRQLRDAAMLPHRHRTWLGHGHTIMSPDRASFDPSTRLSSLIAIDDVDEIGPIDCDGTQVGLFTVWPLYAEERDFALDQGSDALLAKFSDAGCDFVVDPGRRSVAGARVE